MRVVNPATPGLGGPQVIMAVEWLARTGTRFSGGGYGSESGTVADWEGEVRPVFFLNPLGEDRRGYGNARLFERNHKFTDSFVKGLILAQNERWRRGLGMQVERVW